MYRFSFWGVLLCCLIGCSDSKPLVEFRMAEYQPVDGWNQMTPRSSDQAVWVSPDTEITNKHIASSHQTLDSFGYPAINLKLTDQGADIMWDFSEKQNFKPIAILIDGELIAAPMVNSPMRSDVMIQGGPGGFESKELDRMLKAF